jgi:hypothetical protein
MNRTIADSYIMAGDLRGLYLNMPVGMTISQIFAECISYAQGHDLDMMIGNCLNMKRAVGADSQGMVIEGDVDYRNRAIAIAPQLDEWLAKVYPDGRSDIYWYNFDYSSFNSKCSHQFVPYHVLSETYEYCTLCNEKKV